MVCRKNALYKGNVFDQSNIENQRIYGLSNQMEPTAISVSDDGFFLVGYACGSVS